MKTLACSLIAAASLALTGAVFAAGKDYQATGPIVEVDSGKIVIEKGKNKERWEFTRDSNTKADTDPKVGDKVTVHYTMTATNIEAKGAKGGAKADKGSKNELKAAASPSPSATP